MKNKYFFLKVVFEIKVIGAFIKPLWMCVIFVFYPKQIINKLIIQKRGKIKYIEEQIK